MKIESVTYYVSEDGRRFKSCTECQMHEVLKRKVDSIMESIPDWPKDCHEVIKVDREVLFTARRKLWELILEKYGDNWPEWKKYNADEIHPLSGVGRVLSDGDNGPLEEAWRKFGAINFETCCVYQQPFYALNPNHTDLMQG